jgi:hypothetical protein
MVSPPVEETLPLRIPAHFSDIPARPGLIQIMGKRGKVVKDGDNREE